MDVLDLDSRMLDDYQRFARSFAQIRAKDIHDGVDRIYATNHFWPDPLISINPNFKKGASVADLAAEGVLRTSTAQIFHVDGSAMRLHCHQEESVAKAHLRKSFVVYDGDRSRKSMCVFIPILDAAVRARVAGESLAPAPSSSIP